MQLTIQETRVMQKSLKRFQNEQSERQITDFVLFESGVNYFKVGFAQVGCQGVQHGLYSFNVIVINLKKKKPIRKSLNEIDTSGSPHKTRVQQ